MADRLSRGPGRLLIGVYAVFALSAGARAGVQIATDFSNAPEAYLLSAFAAVVYLVATYGLARGGRTGRLIALTCCSVVALRRWKRPSPTISPVPATRSSVG